MAESRIEYGAQGGGSSGGTTGGGGDATVVDHSHFTLAKSGDSDDTNGFRIHVYDEGGSGRWTFLGELATPEVAPVAASVVVPSTDSDDTKGMKVGLDIIGTAPNRTGAHGNDRRLGLVEVEFERDPDTGSALSEDPISDGKILMLPYEKSSASVTSYSVDIINSGDGLFVDATAAPVGSGVSGTTILDVTPEKLTFSGGSTLAQANSVFIKSNPTANDTDGMRIAPPANLSGAATNIDLLIRDNDRLNTNLPTGENRVNEAPEVIMIDSGETTFAQMKTFLEGRSFVCTYEGTETGTRVIPSSETKAFEFTGGRDAVTELQAQIRFRVSGGSLVQASQSQTIYAHVTARSGGVAAGAEGNNWVLRVLADTGSVTTLSASVDTTNKRIEVAVKSNDTSTLLEFVSAISTAGGSNFLSGIQGTYNPAISAPTNDIDLSLSGGRDAVAAAAASVFIPKDGTDGQTEGINITSNMVGPAWNELRLSISVGSALTAGELFRPAPTGFTYDARYDEGVTTLEQFRTLLNNERRFIATLAAGTTGSEICVIPPTYYRMQGGADNAYAQVIVPEDLDDGVGIIVKARAYGADYNGTDMFIFRDKTFGQAPLVVDQRRELRTPEEMANRGDLVIAAHGTFNQGQFVTALAALREQQLDAIDTVLDTTLTAGERVFDVSGSTYTYTGYDGRPGTTHFGSIPSGTALDVGGTGVGIGTLVHVSSVHGVDIEFLQDPDRPLAGRYHDFIMDVDGTEYQIGYDGNDDYYKWSSGVGNSGDAPNPFTNGQTHTVKFRIPRVDHKTTLPAVSTTSGNYQYVGYMNFPNFVFGSITDSVVQLGAGRTISISSLRHIRHNSQSNERYLEMTLQGYSRFTGIRHDELVINIDGTDYSMRWDDSEDAYISGILDTSPMADGTTYDIEIRTPGVQVESKFDDNAWIELGTDVEYTSGSDPGDGWDFEGHQLAFAGGVDEVPPGDVEVDVSVARQFKFIWNSDNSNSNTYGELKDVIDDFNLGRTRYPFARVEYRGNGATGSKAEQADGTLLTPTNMDHPVREIGGTFEVAGDTYTALVEVDDSFEGRFIE